MNDTALVVGVTGMIGSALAESLVEDGWTVHGAARLRDDDVRAALEAEGIECHRFDVTADDPAALPDVDVVWLEIWDPDDPRTWEINFHGVGRVVERYTGIADVVNGCTINVYGDGPEPASEGTPPRPTDEYGRSRYAQERLIDYFCGRSDSDGIHVRYAHTNTATTGLVRRFAECILAGEPLGEDPAACVQVIALEDAVRVTQAALADADTPPPGVNVTHPQVWTKRELAEAIHDRLGAGEVVFTGSGGREGSAYAEVDRMCDWYGEPSIPVDEVLDRVVDAVEPN